MLENISCIETAIQKNSKSSETTLKRQKNIQWVKRLDREGLELNKKEKQILFKATNFNEEISIQYPGKESASSRVVEKRRPWDFRPKVFNKEQHKYIDDWAFVQIWNILFESLENSETKEEIPILATIFYRMAYMLDHVQIPDNTEMTVKFISIESNKVIETKENFNSLLIYEPNKKIIDNLKGLSNIIDKYGGMSLEAFLYLNELLAWNEDCKYYYRNLQNKTDKWIGTTGRINTLLTHIAIMGLVIGKVKLSDILGRFSQQRGVAPATNKEIINICYPLIYQSNHPLGNH